MTLITALMVTSLAAFCGPTVSPTTTDAIIRVESGGNPYVIGDNSQRKSYSPKTKEEAVNLAENLLSQGHNIDMGLMQINSIHLKHRNLSLEDIFTPCTNIHIGTSILAEFYQRHNNDPDKRMVLFKALSAYNTGSAWKGQNYINKILRAAGAPYRVRYTMVSSTKPVHKNTMKNVSKTPLRPENSSLFFHNITAEVKDGEAQIEDTAR